MVESLTSEAKWAETLQHLPTWTPPDRPILVIAPHPDDETLGAGGLIAAARMTGIEVRVAAVTDGENAYPDNNSDQIDTLRVLRRQEQLCALGHLGVTSESVLRLALPDSSVQTEQQQLINKLLELVSADTHILAPWRNDFHPDHQACGLAAEEVARIKGARLTSYFFWTWHQGSPDEMRKLPLVCFPLTPDLIEKKSQALQCHRSQLYRQSDDPILPDHLLEPARRSFETYSVSE